MTKHLCIISTNCHEMNQSRDISVSFLDPKHQKVDETVSRKLVNEATDVKHLLSEPESKNISLNALLGIDEHNPTGVEDVTHGCGFDFTSTYGGTDSFSTLEGEEGLKFEIFDGFLDEIDEVDDICAAHDLSTACNRFLLDFEFADKVSELDSRHGGVCNCSPGSPSSGFSGSIDGGNGVSELLKKVSPESESRNGSLDKEVVSDDHEMLKNNCAYQEPNKEGMISTTSAVQKLDELDEGEKPIASFTVSEKKIRLSMKNKRKRTPRLKEASLASYHFRPQRECTKKSGKCPPKMDQQSDHESPASEFEDDHPKAKASKRKCDRRKQQRMWTTAEVMKLVDGISQFGAGKWTDMKRLLFPSASYRTPIDLRDKWRNLLRASYSRNARQKNDHGKVDINPKKGMRHLPSHLVHRIHDLAAHHPYPNSKSSVRRTPRRKNQI